MIYELVNLREIFQKSDKLQELKRLEVLTKFSLFEDDPLIRRKIIQLISEEYNLIRKIFTGDNQIMAEVYIIGGKELIVKNAYICEIPKEHSGEHAEILIKSFK